MNILTLTGGIRNENEQADPMFHLHHGDGDLYLSACACGWGGIFTDAH